MDLMRTAGMTVLLVALVMFGGSAAIPQATQPKHAEVPEEQRVDINHASLEELLKVPGMTKSWAGRIVRFRPYRTKVDLVDRGIVSGEVYNRIKEYVVAHREERGPGTVHRDPPDHRAP